MNPAPRGLAERICGARKPLDRPDLVAQEQRRDTHKNQRRANHPKNENVRRRYRSTLARHDHAQHTVVHLHADIKIIAGAGRHKVPIVADLLRDRIVQRAESILLRY
ncbi:MAG: hypothetical protein WDM89_12930 [Rhizomicrobium sp.]